LCGCSGVVGVSASEAYRVLLAGSHNPVGLLVGLHADQRRLLVNPRSEVSKLALQVDQQESNIREDFQLVPSAAAGVESRRAELPRRHRGGSNTKCFPDPRCHPWPAAVMVPSSSSSYAAACTCLQSEQREVVTSHLSSSCKWVGGGRCHGCVYTQHVG
jgi:hypothetical protein